MCCDVHVCACARVLVCVRAHLCLLLWNQCSKQEALLQAHAPCSSTARPTTKSSADDPACTLDASAHLDKSHAQSEGPHADHEVASMRRALLYRSRQTGWLETDLIMGRWAAENLDKLTLPELQEYARIVQVM